MTAARRPVQKLVKVTDETTPVRCAAGHGLIREEVWEDAEGNVVRFNLAFINFHLYPRDHGRVLGYDSAHGYPHRHFVGVVEKIEPAHYGVIYSRFMAEVELLKERSRLWK
jgi:hypothetical protein